jgi:acyl-CoA reductase-like NAD-dependent aldehyde dehydrogenase
VAVDLAVPIGDDRFVTGEWIDVRAPYDGALLGRVPACGRREVDTAVAAARHALDEPLAAWRRAEILDRAAAAVAQQVDELARTIALEAAKPIRTARVEAQRCASTFTFAAHAARALAGEMVPLDASPAGEGKLAFTLRVPIGVVGAISPFNFPLNLVAHKVAPAIAAGCPVVVKPASTTPMSALALADLLADCGLPSGNLNVVTGSGESVGDALVEHPDVAMISFTGSAPVGWSIRAKAPRKKVGLELGNNAPLILEPSGDVEECARKVAVAGFSHAGQSCISTQRLLVHERVAPAFLDRLLPLVDALVVGDPLDEATDVSALISTAERDRVRSWIDEAVAGGAEILVGGGVGDDGVLRPTVLGGVEPGMKVCAREVFGPLVTLQTYSRLDDAIRLANDTVYGLQAAIFTADLAGALRAARELDFGGVLVNEVPTFRADQQPYGGRRDSGNTREGPRYAVAEMTETRLVVIQA